jgi:hypothetical protein
MRSAHGTVLCGVVWCCVVWCGVVWCGDRSASRGSCRCRWPACTGRASGRSRPSVTPCDSRSTSTGEAGKPCTLRSHCTPQAHAHAHGPCGESAQSGRGETCRKSRIRALRGSGGERTADTEDLRSRDSALLAGSPCRCSIPRTSTARSSTSWMSTSSPRRWRCMGTCCQHQRSVTRRL